MIFHFRKTYFLFSMLLLFAEILIGIYVHDSLIRPFGGDFLVVIFLYCLVKSFSTISVFTAAIGVLIFAYAIEVSQYFPLVNLLGLQSFKLAKILLGPTFSFYDLLAYTLGILLVLTIEKIKSRLNNFKTE